MKGTRGNNAARKRWLAGTVLLLFSTSCATTGVPTDNALQQSSDRPSPPAASSAARVVDVTDVQVRANGPGEASIVVTADGAIVDYKSFALHDPPRLVIDLPHARYAVSQPVTLPAGSPILRVQTLQLQESHIPVLRLVFDLGELFPYRVELIGNSLQILVSAEVSEQVPAAQGPTQEERVVKPVASTVEPPTPGRVEPAEEGARGVKPEALAIVVKPATKADQPTPSSEKPHPLPNAEGTMNTAAAMPLQTEKPPAVSPPTVKEETLPPLPQPAASAVAKPPSRAETEGSEQNVQMEASPLPLPAAEQPIAPAPATPTVAAANKRFTLDFEETKLDTLLRLISKVSGLNIVYDPDAKEIKDRKVTVRLKDVEWRQALDVILRAKGLSYEQDGNMIYVDSTAEIQKGKEKRAKDIEAAAVKTVRIEGEKRKVEEAKRKGEEERRSAEEEERRYAEEPPCMKVIHLAHAKAADVKKRLERQKTRRGSVEIDERTNTVIVNDVQSVCLKMTALAKELDMPKFVTKMLRFNYVKPTDLKTYLTAMMTKEGGVVVVDERSYTANVTDLPEVVEKMESYLKQIDIPTPQVLIEARIVEASRSFSQSLGIQWGGTGIATKPGSTTGVGIFGGQPSSSIQFPNPIAPSPASPFVDPANPIPSLGPVPLALNLPAANPYFVLGATIGSLTNRFLVGTQLSVAESAGKIKTLSSPRVATQDNEEAEIKQGTQVPYTTIDSSGRTVVQFQDAFIKLKVKPHIMPDGRVSIKVEAERSFPGDRVDFKDGFVFPINTRKATTNIIVQNGSTVVIGGLMQSREGSLEDKVPFFGDIPLLGWLFKRRTIGPDDKNELLIFITPSILQESRL